jgi:hypothetical protein
MYVTVSSPESRANNDMRTANKSSENVAWLKYFGMTETNQNNPKQTNSIDFSLQTNYTN